MDMDMLIVIGIFALIAGFWCWVIIAVGRAAVVKGRSRTIWGLLAFMPLGPIGAPLWLASMPHVDEKATKLQLIGRTVLIVLVAFNFLMRLGLETMNQQNDTETVTKAEEDYGFKTEYVTKHNKKMSVDEIVKCITLKQSFETMQYDADYDAANETHYFKTDAQADIYNDLVANYNEMECDDRTYDVTDLDRAMKIIEGGS